MASIPGFQLSLTGASGSNAALTPKSGWFAYVFPRGAWASQDSSGTQITFDSSDIAARFAANNWIQVGTNTANIRKVSGVGGNSITVQGSAVTVTENDRVFIIGSTQPSVSGGSATYIVPATVIRSRDDDSSDRYTNSVVTSNSNGLVQAYATLGLYDVLLQDGNQSNQGYIADLPVGVAEGISTTFASVFGATVLINAVVGITGNLTVFGNIITGGSQGTIAALGSMSTSSSMTVAGLLDQQGLAQFGVTATFNAGIGVTGAAAFGRTVTISSGLTVSGSINCGTTLTAVGITSGSLFTRDVRLRRLYGINGTTLTAAGFTLSSTWGSTSVISLSGSPSYDTHGTIQIDVGGSGIGSTPSVTLTFVDGAFSTTPIVMLTRGGATGHTSPWFATASTTQAFFTFAGVPVGGQAHVLQYLVIG